MIRAVVCVAAMALSGCGRPAAQKAHAAASSKASDARQVTPAGGQSSVGLNEPCVGLGCEGQVSAGMKKGCVGMGCPPDDAKPPE